MTEPRDAYPSSLDAAIAAVERRSDHPVALMAEIEDRLNDAFDKTFAELMPVENWLLGPAHELFGRLTLSRRSDPAHLMRDV